jgi:hypothetical protein
MKLLPHPRQVPMNVLHHSSIATRMALPSSQPLEQKFVVFGRILVLSSSRPHHRPTHQSSRSLSRAKAVRPQHLDLASRCPACRQAQLAATTLDRPLLLKLATFEPARLIRAPWASPSLACRVAHELPQLLHVLRMSLDALVQHRTASARK